MKTVKKFLGVPIEYDLSEKEGGFAFSISANGFSESLSFVCERSVAESIFTALSDAVTLPGNMREGIENYFTAIYGKRG